MLGFELDFWDYATLAPAALASFVGVMAVSARYSISASCR